MMDPTVIIAVLLYLIRMVEIVTLSITTFCVCYLVWMHNNHYCTSYWCSGSPLNNTSVPIGEVMMIVACIIVTLEFLFSIGVLALKNVFGKNIHIFTQLCTSASALMAFTLGIAAHTAIPTIHQSWPYCWDMYKWTWRDAPEKYQCIVAQTSVTCGLITWITLLIITGIVVYEYRTSQYMGSIRLTNEEPGAMDIGQSDGNGAEST